MIVGISMRAYRLRWADRSLEIASTVNIGRSPECEIVVDEPEVSQRHATLVRLGSELWASDASGRNGVLVNGVRIEGRQRLGEGDTLRVGTQEFVVASEASSVNDPAAEVAETTRRFHARGAIVQLADKALALGRVDEAERLLAQPLDLLLREAKAGSAPDIEVLNKATDLVVRLLEGTRRGAWLDWLVQMYGASRRPWPAPVVDALYQVARGAIGHDRSALRTYCRLLRSVQSELGPAERFQIGRIEGLDRVLSAF
jgi:pSer/pThr/pTyr-binding forkhead associated (FHA) protein